VKVHRYMFDSTILWL